MAVFNQNIYDLNNKRGYCVDGAYGFPAEVISDLKVSVPNDTDQIMLRGLYLQGEILRLTLTARSQQREIPVALFTSDMKSSLRIGEPYLLQPAHSAYGGTVVFGAGIKNDDIENTSFQVSEECLTRYWPSRIPYAGQTCDSLRLTGEVRIVSGDPSRVTTDGVDIEHPALFFSIAKRGLRIRLLDNGLVSPENPMIEMANGINSYFGTDGGRSPVYKLFGALPDSEGAVYVLFDSYFHFAGVTDDFDDSDATISRLAVGTHLTMEDVCGSDTPKEPELGEEPCDPNDIGFEVINCEVAP